MKITYDYLQNVSEINAISLRNINYKQIKVNMCIANVCVCVYMYIVAR